MVMSWIIMIMLLISVICAIISGNGAALAAATATGAQAGITLAISMVGSLCLWSGVGKLMERAGLTAALSRLIKPLLNRLFPSTRSNPVLADICLQILYHIFLTVS